MGLLAVSGWANFLNIFVILIGLFMGFLILIQRGKGGGLAGAFGGPGGSSSFGSKTGDKFMWFTIYLSIAWVLLLVIQTKIIDADNRSSSEGIKTRLGN